MDHDEYRTWLASIGHSGEERNTMVGASIPAKNIEEETDRTPSKWLVRQHAKIGK